MKFTNAIVLLGSLIAHAVVNAKTCGSASDGKTRVRRIKICFLNDDRCFVTALTRSYTPFECYSISHLQVKIICEGDAKDFGVAGNGIFDCFKQTFSTSGQCKDIPVTIKYKIINPNMGEGSNFDMKLDFFTMIRTLQMMEPDRSPTTP
jgi:hypothetical protein